MRSRCRRPTEPTPPHRASAWSSMPLPRLQLPMRGARPARSSSMKTGKRSVCPRVLPRVLLLAFAGVCAAHAAGLKYWVEPCERPAEMGCKRGDPDLAQWAMEAWQAASDGKLHVERTAEKNRAIIKIYWVSSRAGLY